MIGIVHLGLGNIGSVERAFARLKIPATLLTAPKAGDCSHLVFPGVGHFGRGCSLLTPAWRNFLNAWISEEWPFLGICLGYQLLHEGSDEAPEAKGLGVFPGICRRVPSERVPHMGWNRLKSSQPQGRAFDGQFMYFTHSFAPVAEGALWNTEDGSIPFGVGSVRGPVTGVQFHPEKSAEAGSRLLQSFWEGSL